MVVAVVCRFCRGRHLRRLCRLHVLRRSLTFLLSAPFLRVAIAAVGSVVGDVKASSVAVAIGGASEFVVAPGGAASVIGASCGGVVQVGSVGLASGSASQAAVSRDAPNSVAVVELGAGAQLEPATRRFEKATVRLRSIRQQAEGLARNLAVSGSARAAAPTPRCPSARCAVKFGIGAAS